MLILHLAYEQNVIYLWGERSFERSLPPLRERAGTVMLPWCARPPRLRAALEEMGIRSARRAGETSIYTYLLLPAKGPYPLPSDPILGDAHETGDALRLSAYSVPAIRVSFQELAAMLRTVQESGDRPPVTGVLLSDDFKYVCRALEYAAVLVQRGSYIPDMEPFCGSFVSQWRPIILSKYLDEFSAFTGAMPAVLCGFSTIEPPAAAKTKKEAAMALLDGFTDSIARTSQSGGAERGRRVNAGNPHEIWLRSLLWQRTPLDKWQDEMETLYPQIRSWADSLKAVTAQPWRLFMRIEEPPCGDGEKAWRLTWHLQSTQDPTLIIPAEKVWSPGAAERAWFEHTHTNPRRYMLQILGHLAARIPLIADSLETPYPCECRLDSDGLFDFLQNHITSIMDQGIQVQLPSAWGQLSDRPRLSVRAALRDGGAFVPGSGIGLSDMLDVDWSVALGGDVITKEELEMLTELKTPLTNFRGRWMIIYRDEVEKIASALHSLPEKIERRDALLSSLRQDYLGAPLSAVSGSPWLDSVKDLLSGSAPLEEAEAPEGFNGKLRPYQARGLTWLLRLTRLGMGACLADDMGLGKTVQTLAMLQTLRLAGETRPILLICPTSVMENWRREAGRFVPSMKTLVHHGQKRAKKTDFSGESLKSSLVISSYSMLHRDAALFAKTDWAGIILDEAQNIKNPDTHQSRAARAVQADWRVALTGTPVENHVGDMWALMEFLVPGLMPNRARFSREILRPVQAGEKKAQEKVRRMTAPFILRRLKTDKEIISDLPEKIETKEFCSLSREQATLYSAVAETLSGELAEAEGIKRKGMVLGAITALKQICDHPLLYVKDRSDYKNRSGKLARLAEITEEMLSAGDRALIFTQYAEMGAILKKCLQETFGREALFLHGGVPREKRDEMVRRFQEEKEAPPFFILSLKAGGTGLNLTRANHVIMFDRWWNPAVEQQAVDRAYRIGQRDNVQVHYFCCRGTLEEKIEALIESKKELAEILVGSGESWISELADVELRELFALDREAVDGI